jgi:outer membrane protein TolC
LVLFTDRLLPAAEDNSKASLAAYQSGVSEFTTLMRARITEYELQLDYARARIDQMIARARLLYVSGDRS